MKYTKDTAQLLKALLTLKPTLTARETAILLKGGKLWN